MSDGPAGITERDVSGNGLPAGAAPGPPSAALGQIPPGASFRLGWVMAQLFDEFRLVRPYMRTIDTDRQLPTVSDLDVTERKRMAVAELIQLIWLFPEMEPAAVAFKASAGTSSIQQDDFVEKLRSLHLAILEAEVADPARLSAYHLGIKLSDLCWIPFLRDPWEKGPVEGWASQFLNAFRRREVAELHMLLRAASETLPNLAAATVSKSLEYWQDWADVMARESLQPSSARELAPQVLLALRLQGEIWHQLLSVETSGEDETDVRTIAALRWLRPVVAVGLLTAVVLYLVVTNFSGTAKVLTTIGTISAALGVTAASLLSAARKAANAFGWNRQTTAKAEARVWSVTLLPAIPLSAMQRSKLGRRGVRQLPVRRFIDAL
jgi:hypothetical protein